MCLFRLLFCHCDRHLAEAIYGKRFVVRGFGGSVLDGGKGMAERLHVCGSVVKLLS